MKRAIKIILLIITVILFFDIGKILLFDFNRLTDYGYGYLIGKIILLMFFGGLTLMLNKYKRQ